MKDYRKGVRAVIYKIKDKKPLYLVLKRKLRWTGWELLKGGKLKNETYEKTLLRELREETGCKKKFVKKIIPIKNKDKFDYPEEFRKVFRKKGFEAKDFIVEVKPFKIKLNEEHSTYKWLSYGEAKKILTHKDAKKVLEKANKILKKAIKSSF